MSTSTHLPEPADPLGPLKRRLAAFTLVALTTVAALAAGAACTFAIVGQIGAGDSPYSGWIAILAAGAAGSRLLVFVYRRLVEPPDRRGIRGRLG